MTPPAPLEETTFIIAIETIGTIAFAISGIRLAAAKRFDWFGAYVVGLVTAIGGGTLRDLLIGVPAFWMVSWLYVAVTFLSLVTVLIWQKILVKGFRTLFVFDAIGLALFVVVGIEKTLLVGYPMWVAIIMGIITGSFGGIARDILIQELPLFFRKDFYATACLLGGLAYWFVSLCGGSPLLSQIICAVSVIGLRVMANTFNWSLPILQVDPNALPEDSLRQPKKNANTHN